MRTSERLIVIRVFCRDGHGGGYCSSQEESAWNQSKGEVLFRSRHLNKPTNEHYEGFVLFQFRLFPGALTLAQVDVGLQGLALGLVHWSPSHLISSRSCLVLCWLIWCVFLFTWRRFLLRSLNVIGKWNGRLYLGQMVAADAWCHIISSLIC